MQANKSRKMIKISQLKINVNHSEAELENKISKLLKRPVNSFTYKILKRSIDARKKPELFYVYTIGVEIKNEKKVAEKAANKNIIIAKDNKFFIPESGDKSLDKRPVIIGAGPAGLFCGLILSEAGYRPVIIERGKAIEDRTKDVEEFWKTGVLNTKSNVQFGEGGAGTFSDGKLNTAIKDPNGIIYHVLEIFVKFGADSQILYDNKPHIGTDVLSKVIVNIRKYLIEKGCQIFFEHQAEDFIIENNKITAVKVNGKNIETDLLILALGHSSRDTFRKLQNLNVPMSVKNFAVGFRVEHPQVMINKTMYGIEHSDILGASPYKVTSNFPNGRGVYSFCMCPGGYVVNSSSEEGRTVVNGMSYSGRNSKNANSAIIISVTPEDFGATDALAGLRYQERIEEECFKLANGKIPQQLFGDFCNNKVSTSYGDYGSETKGLTAFENLRGIFSPDMERSFIAGMNHFNKFIDKFDRYDAIMSGIESRTSSPVRIERDQFFESKIEGIYPCGEGAGYAGGITSAAADGIKVACAIIKKYKPGY